MKKNHLMLTIGLIVITIMIMVIGYIVLFHYGNPRAEQLFVTNIDVNEDQIWLEGSTSSSNAEAYKDYDYEIKGDSVYITIKYVMASDAYPHSYFDIRIKDDFSRIKKVYLTDGEYEKLLWDVESLKTTTGAITTTMAAVTLPVDRIVSGEAIEGRVGGTYRYQLTDDELKAFIDHFNSQGYSDKDRKEPSMSHTAMDDSIDLVLQTNDGKTITILFYYDEETVITDQDNNSYSIFDPALTNYMNKVIGWYLLEKGKFE